jgi:5-methylcytosine-specific restriction endonuclease McrA
LRELEALICPPKPKRVVQTPEERKLKHNARQRRLGQIRRDKSRQTPENIAKAEAKHHEQQEKRVKKAESKAKHLEQLRYFKENADSIKAAANERKREAARVKREEMKRDKAAERAAHLQEMIEIHGSVEAYGAHVQAVKQAVREQTQLIRNHISAPIKAAARERHNTTKQIKREAARKQRYGSIEAYKAHKQAIADRAAATKKARQVWKDFKKRTNSKTGERTTFEMMKRMMAHQNNRCVYCQTDISDSYTFDHIYPISKGGVHAEFNLQLLCMLCNSQKNDMLDCEYRAFLVQQQPHELHSGDERPLYATP